MLFGPRSTSSPSSRLVAVLSRAVVALGALSLAVGIAHAAAVPVISNPTPVSFGSQAVGSAQAQTTVTFTVTGGGTLNTKPLVLTTGQPNLDYTIGTSSTCTGTVTGGSTCTVNVIFTPRAPGQRLGAVVLQAGTSTIATALLYGTGTGPAVVFPGNTAINTLGSGFSTPFGVAVDGAGDVYVADNSHGLVKEIVAVGGSIPASNPTINTLVPSGTFSGPAGVAVDGAGNVYVADTGNNAVKEIVAVGGSIPASNPTITTLGSGFTHPYGVAVDGAGNVYVADAGHSLVKEIVAVGGSIPASNPTINTLVPSGTFNSPYGVAVDGAGNVYVADYGHSAVKEIVAVGGSIPASNPTINTLGPSGTFSSPEGVAVDGAGNVYVADTGHSLVKEIVAVGGSIPASNPTINLLGPSGTFSHPYGVAVDGAGNVYVSDYANNAVKEIPLATPPSLTFASTSVGNTSSNSPQTLTLQNIGNTSLTFPIPASGTSPAISSNYTLSGSGTCPQLTTSTSAAQTLAPGTCTAVVSFTPVMPSAAAGSIIFTDNSYNVTNATQTVTLTGTATGATGATAQTITFSQPTTPAQASTTATLTASSTSGLAIVYSVVSGPATLSGSTVTYTGAGTVVLEADQYGNNTYAAATAVQRTVSVQTATGVAGPTQTATVTITTAGTLGTIYVLTTGQPYLDYTVASGGTCTVGTAYAVNATCTVNYVFTPKAPGQRLGAVQLVANDNATVMGTALLTGTGTGAAVVFPGNTAINTLGPSGTFSYPPGVAVDGAGNVYVADFNHNAVKEIVAVGGCNTTSNPTINTLGPTGTFSYPTGVAVDGAGDVYVADATLNAVKEIVAVGGCIPASNPTINTLEPSGTFSGPTGVAVDGAGNVYVADTSNNAVKEIVAVGGCNTTSNPTINTLGPSGTFSLPHGVAVDGAGNVYVADYGHSAVKEILAVGGCIPANPTITTLGPSGTFSNPTGVAVDGAGNVYVADTYNQAVKEIVAVGGSIPASSPTIRTLGPSFTFSLPFGVAVDGAGNVYVADYGNSLVKEIPLATPPSLSFASTAVGATSSDSPKTLLLQNIGNASLSFPAPGAGNNPSIATNFSIGGTSTCPQVATGGTAGSLAPGTCTDLVSFTPTVGGSISGSLVLTDNSLGAMNAVQTVALSGTGTPASVTFGTMSFSPAATEPQGTSQIISISEAITYGGAQPTGAVTFVLNGVTYTATCTTAGSPETCTATVPAATIAALPVASYTVTAALAQDSAYNAGTGNSGTFTVQDTTPPVITTPSNITAEAAGPAGAVVTYTVTAYDAVDGNTAVTCVPASGSTFALGTTQVTCTSTDSHGNKATKSFTVTVQDTTAPSITTPSNQTVEATSPAGAVVTFTATATDTVDGTTAVNCAPVSGSTFALGTTQVTCSSTDAHGNKATKSFTVTVQDTTAPSITTPSNQTVEATSPAGAVVTFTATATDTVDGTTAVNCAPVSGSTFALGTTQVTCSSTDAHGNKATKSFTVTVQDTTAPVITTPSNITLEATSLAGAVATYTVTANDAVSGSTSVTCSPVSGSTFAIGTTQVTCTSTDSHSNKATASFTVKVQDTTAPVITTPSNQTVEATSPAGAVVTYTATATDTVDGTDSVTCSPVSGSTFAVGMTQVSCSSTDAHGNKATKSFTVTVQTVASFMVAGYATPSIVTEGGTVTVSALHSNGTADPYFTGTVTLTSSDTKATLPAAYTFQSSDNGVHTFNVTLNTVGTQSITATSSSATGTQTGVIVGDAIWVLDATGSLVKVNTAGGAAGSAAGASGTASSFGGVAFDSAGDVFSVSAGANALAFATYAGGGATTYTGGGLNAPVAVAVDGAGYVWVANSGNNTVSEFTNGRAAMSPSIGYGTSAAMNAPSSVSIDPTGGVWIANRSGNSVTHIFGAATPVVTPLAAGTLPH